MNPCRYRVFICFYYGLKSVNFLFAIQISREFRYNIGYERGNKKDFDTKGSKKREDEKKTAAAKGTGNTKIVQGYNKRGSAVSRHENIFRE